MRILLVEDDMDLGEAVQRRLRRDGHAVDWQRDGRDADALLQVQRYELVVLDIGLPRLDGLGVLRHLRARGDRTPVLMLTARSEIDDRVDALAVGAADYLSTPFDPREFDARCRALLRRSQGLASGVTRIGTLAFDRAGKVVRIGEGPPLSLPAREFRLLEILVGHVGRVVSKDDIASQLFAFDDDAGENAIELYIGRLRRKLGDALVIRTLRGIGYLVQAPGTDDGA